MPWQVWAVYESIPVWGQPFSASVVVTGDEAKEVLNGGKVNLSDSRLRASVQKSGNNAVITLRSSSAINDPVMIFQMGVGLQARQYTAIIDPPGYRSSSPSRSVNNINSNSQADNGNGNGAQSPLRLLAQAIKLRQAVTAVCLFWCSRNSNKRLNLWSRPAAATPQQRQKQHLLLRHRLLQKAKHLVSQQHPANRNAASLSLQIGLKRLMPLLLVYAHQV